MNDLAELVSQRTDYPWVFLATAAGQKDAVAHTIAALMLDSMEDPSMPYLPSSLREFVEALAAWDVRLLAELAAGWTPPSQIHPTLGWFTLNVWYAALRHIKDFNVVTLEACKACPMRELDQQAELLWRSSPAEILDWTEIDGKLKFKISAARGEYRLNERLLQESDILNMSRSQLSVLLRNSDRLSEDAKNRLVEISSEAVKQYCGSDLWTKKYDYRQKISPTEISMGRVCSLIELCDEIGVNIRPEMTDAFRIRFASVDDPTEIAPLIYTLLGRWYLH
jgi:hypothetical protein